MDLVQILVKQIEVKQKNTSLPKQCLEEVNKENKIGDLVDAIDLVHGSWFEAKIADIKAASISDNNVLQVQQANDQMTKENGATSDDDGLIYQVVFDGYEDCEEPVDLSLHQIRHRARKLIKFEDLKFGDKVMVNYNLEEPKERGFWYDCCVTNLKNGRSTKQLIGTIFVGADSELENCKIIFLDEIFAIEKTITLMDQISVSKNSPIALSIALNVKMTKLKLPVLVKN
ncbi:e3 ubiquitin-protein ligase UHRF1 [Caerostris extrusa]|uniref:E3 ubiquitin-protein ligase UHRF1 n=1 Tax=Caerostris extrusa TaxID=172846 RepID=A0AAV4PC38_CAEEX|nr:e3 ubiquitin-protein ligase UHRF1 [Caerostris extrusa]